MADIASLLKQISDLWFKQIERAEKKKAADFGDTAREIMRYVGKRYRTIPMRSDGDRNDPTPYTTYLNYTQGFIDIMTPYVYAQVPNRQVNPNRPQIPPELEAAIPQIVEMQKQIRLEDSLTSFQLQWFLNWTPNEYDLKTAGTIAVQEALSKGQGVLWLEMADGPFGPIPGSFDDSVDNLLIDPDCKQMRNAGWICRKWEQPIWKIADRFGEDVDKLRATKKSNFKQAADDATQNTENKGDIGTYYEFWSMMGIGDKFVGASQDMKDAHDAFEKLGPYAHFCVMDGLDHPLGMRPEIFTSVSTPEEMAQLFRAALEWPIKTYEVTYNPWPLFCLDFKPRSDCPWPKAILESALPLQIFLDRLYTTLIHRVETAGRDICLTAGDIEEAVETALKSINDLEIVKIPSDVDRATIEKMVNFILP